MTQNLTIIDHPLIQHKLTIMRDRNTPSGLFRQLLHEISLLMGYELMRDLPLTDIEIDTPIETMNAPTLKGYDPCIVSILRAGNGFVDGLLSLVPTAAVGFVGLYRDPETLQPVEYYLKLPKHMNERRIMIVDPMLATGHSAIAAVQKVKDSGAKDIRFLCLVAAPEGVENFTAAHPDVPVYTAALDRQLNENSYIVPGLGDAGDRIFGTK
jgi:uracil phosphoribosyltransferase